MSSDAIFGGTADAPLVLRGIDRRLLHIEARFSHEKRMKKIFSVFPKTFELLGAGRERIIREFVTACQSVGISQGENAREFHRFLITQWKDVPPTPPYLPDVANCEIAFAKVRSIFARQPTAVSADAWREVRRKPSVVLLRAVFDIRAIFETAEECTCPIERDTPLAVTTMSTGEPQIFCLIPEVFELVAALDRWVDATQFERNPEAADLVADLVGAGILEVRE
jgi:hypothetical protein